LEAAGDKPAIGRSIVAIIIVLILVGVAAIAFFSIGSPATPVVSNGTTTSSQGQTTGTQTGSAATGASGGLVITNMFGDVQGAGLQAPYQNSTSVFDQSTYKGHPGEVITVTFDIVYQLCAGRCPSQIIAIIALTQGFSVVSTVPTMPVPVNPTIGVQQEAHITVMVQTPSTPYNGTLTLVAQA
jgi:hypothetical protein